MEVKLPKLGEGADAGVVVSVFVQEGDQLAKDQAILELENEKAVASIPSPVSGKVTRIHVSVGEKISVGQSILTVSEGAGGEAGSTQPSKISKDLMLETVAGTAPVSAEGVAEQKENGPAQSKFPPAVAPSLRKIARELGIDLTKIRGSADGGRIVMVDVRSYIQNLQRLAAKPATPSSPPVETTELIDFSKWGAITKKPMSPLRKTISRRLAESWTTIPHVTQFDEADVTALLELSKKYASAYEAKNARLTLTSFALKVVVTVLKKFPIFNASVNDIPGEIVFKEYFHIGVAVDTDAGLIVPVIRDVDKKDLVSLSRELNELAAKARDRKVSLEELKGGTFTISNQGGIGGAHFTPIINKPEVAILGVGRGIAKPVVKQGRIEPRTMLPLALSYDHRVIDGGQAARFITELVRVFEDFPENDVRL